MTFEGEVDETVGTHLLFTVEEKQKKQVLEYMCSTETTVKMDTIALETKREKRQMKIETDETNEDEILAAIL